MDRPGYAEGDACGRKFCLGIVQMHPSENCSCHIAPPCYSCTEATAFCSVCGWEEADDPLCIRETNSYYMVTGESAWFVVPGEQTKRVLDPTKIDYVISAHSSSSQKVTGVYPEGTTQDEVRMQVKGTFGGRFESFKDGQFVFIAYTD